MKLYPWRGLPGSMFKAHYHLYRLLLTTSMHINTTTSWPNNIMDMKMIKNTYSNWCVNIHKVIDGNQDISLTQQEWSRSIVEMDMDIFESRPSLTMKNGIFMKIYRCILYWTCMWENTYHVGHVHIYDKSSSYPWSKCWNLSSLAEPKY
jgi:hypothetical protein